MELSKRQKALKEFNDIYKITANLLLNTNIDNDDIRLLDTAFKSLIVELKLLKD